MRPFSITIVTSRCGAAPVPSITVAWVRAVVCAAALPLTSSRRGEYDQDIRPHYPSLEHRLFCFFTMTAAPSYQRNEGRSTLTTLTLRRPHAHSWKAFSRVLRNCGNTISRTTATAIIEQRQRDRPVDEDHRIAAREHQRAAQILLHQRPQDEAEHQRRRLAAELEQEIAEQREQRREHDVGRDCC